MRCIPEGTEIVLWGIGKIGRQIIEGGYGDHKVFFAVDSKVAEGTEDRIGDIPVYPPSVLNDPSVLGGRPLVIGVYYWAEIAAGLESEGKHIFRDYVPYTYLRDGPLDIGFLRLCKDEEERERLLKSLASGKKLCGVYGFCHAPVYAALLEKSEEFRERYCLIEIPPANFTWHPHFDILRTPWLRSIVSSLDLLILCFVYPDKKRLGTPDWRTVKGWTDAGCKVVTVTNAFFKGYFPQHVVGVPELSEEIRWGDKNLNKMILAGETAGKMFQTISAPDFYDAEEAERFYEHALNRLERTEAECDVRIADHIRRYGRQRRLMYSSNHPHESVMKEIAMRIFKEIGLDTRALAAMPESDVSIPFLRGCGEFIYPSVYHALGIAEQEDEKISVGADEEDLITLSEYVGLYVELNGPYIRAEHGG